MARLLPLLLLSLSPTLSAQPAAFTGNHALSTPDAGLSAVTLNPAQFGVFLSPLGHGELQLTVNDITTGILSLNWTGDGVFPGGELRAALAGVDLSLRVLAPLSPFAAEAGFLPLLLAQLTATSAAAPATVALRYTFNCSGLYSACAGGGGAAPAPAPAPGAPAFAAAAQVFVGAALGDANAAAAQGCVPLAPRVAPLHPQQQPLRRPRTAAAAAAAAAALTDPPTNFTQVGGVGTSITCPFGGWGAGGSLAECEVSCVEDAACNAINFNPSIADCVFRVCPPGTPTPPPTAPAPGYAAYFTLAPKPPRPLLCASASAALAPGATPRRLLLALGHHEPAGRYAPAFPTPQALFAYAVGAAAELAAAQAAFVTALPTTGSAARDASVRWLTAPAILLTKGVRSQVSTMGYTEMCSRDSFWTTWLHAYMWQSLDRGMVAEFAAWQCNASVPACGGAGNDGKIPTTILPPIYRDDNIDITAYFVLRLARYVQVSGDEALLVQLYPALKRALLYLLRRSSGRDGGGLPAASASSQWADWMDVSYFVGRKYAPHFVAVTLAALRVGVQAAGVCGQPGDGAVFAAALAAGLAYMQGPLTCGSPGGACGASGMWNASGGYFGDVWWDGSRRNYTLSDQFVAAFFSVTDEARAGALLAHLLGPAAGTNGPAGIRDLYPYLHNVSDPPAVYGNGAAYLWMNCGVAATLLAQEGGQGAGWALWDKVTAQSLYSPTQPVLHQSWEYLNGDTGAAMGAAPFGGDGACFAVASMGGSHWWGLVEPPVVAVPLLQPPATAAAAAAAAAQGQRRQLGAPRAFALVQRGVGGGWKELLRPLGGGLWALMRGQGGVRVVGGVLGSGAWVEAGSGCALVQGSSGSALEVHACSLPSGENITVSVQRE